MALQSHMHAHLSDLTPPDLNWTFDLFCFVGMGLCPFTSTATHGGRPMAAIYYTVTRGYLSTQHGAAHGMAAFYCALWREAADVIAIPEKDRYARCECEATWHFHCHESQRGYQFDQKTKSYNSHPQPQKNAHYNVHRMQSDLVAGDSLQRLLSRPEGRLGIWHPSFQSLDTDGGCQEHGKPGPEHTIASSDFPSAILPGAR